MIHVPVIRHATPWALAMSCLLALPAQAASSPSQDPASAELANARGELARARTDLAQAARRVAGLSREQAGPGMGAAARLADDAARPRLGVLLGEDPKPASASPA
ncbi:hypothetical protein [Pseudoxanthomonas suwonensis]